MKESQEKLLVSKRPFASRDEVL